MALVLGSIRISESGRGSLRGPRFPVSFDAHAGGLHSDWETRLFVASTFERFILWPTNANAPISRRSPPGNQAMEDKPVAMELRTRLVAQIDGRTHLNPTKTTAPSITLTCQGRLIKTSTPDSDFLDRYAMFYPFSYSYNIVSIRPAWVTSKIAFPSQPLMELDGFSGPEARTTLGVRGFLP
ncbi:hypothetical protein PROAA_1350013 [Candidatus Propionivibrio aalborgensis]|uniref:Uncharacterized protein n=1 Tax=Candidatus Propionivibrio aalborgensis TaxID=1860101 RepID=A0A1A8XK38_9RHOO|nr:hypothetical protein PROAA_1350013 [Candidatus Propionivibrio aalborgensis]